MSTLVFSSCFLIRVIVFMYRTTTNKYLDYGVFLTFGYIIPEIIPTLVQLLIITTTKKREIHESKYIQQLYDEEENLENA